jgi:hypothetical protein
MIPERYRTGISGQTEIQSRLSSVARLMPAIPDVSFDFFCQLIENDLPSPNKFFWVQAKATKSLNDYWKEGIDKRTIETWLSQIFPVFVIVYDEASRNCYWTSVEDNRNYLTSKLGSEFETISLRIDKSHILGRGYQENTKFIRKIESDIILVSAVHGIPKMIGEGYVRVIPVLKLSGYVRSEVANNIRISLDYLIYDCILENDLQNAYRFSQILSNFDHGHYDHFLVLARICLQLGKKQEAIDNYDAAIEICKRDKNWNMKKGVNDPSIEDIISLLENEKKDLLKT